MYTSMPTGRRCSSAICPSSPAARASRAKPRSSSTGRPRSASAAPQTPAPLSGSLRREHLLVHPADGLEQPQVRAAQPLLPGDLDQHRRAGIGHLVHRVPEAGHEPPGGPGLPHRRQRHRVPALVGQKAAHRPSVLQHVVQVAAAVLGDPQEPGPTAEQPGGQRPLQRVWGGQVGEPGGDRGRGEPVVGQRHQHGLEHPGLGRGGPPQRDQPEGELAEADLAHQVRGQVLAEQPDLVGRRGAERGGEGKPIGAAAHPPASSLRAWLALEPIPFGLNSSGSASHRRISAPCWSRAGGGSR